MFSTVLFFVVDYFLIHTRLFFRYVGFIQVPLILFVASQTIYMERILKKALVVIMVLVAMDYTYVYFRDDLRHPHQDWRKTSHELAQEIKTGDVVLSLVNIPTFQYYYKNDVKNFIQVSESFKFSDVLFKNRMSLQKVGSIFVLYKQERIPDIRLDGFSLDDRTSHGEIGFLHFHKVGMS
ncbi:MAG: hypothetical protein HQL13_08195 [Candidatus Omnitrophica bacterium]|nr:hypothetical protein [Candidatus Omnitrophota bacterium]